MITVFYSFITLPKIIFVIIFIPDKTVKCNMDSLKGSPKKESEKKQQYISLKDVNKVLFLNAH